MSNTRKGNHVKLTAAGVLSVLMAPSAVLAERESLYQYVPDDYLRSIPEKYFRVSHCENCIAHNPNPTSRTRYPEPPRADGDIPASADAEQQASIKELSQKTADPTSDIALVFTQWAMTFNNGDLNRGDAKRAANVVFQPIIPIPIYGRGDDEWRIVSRPTINFFGHYPTPRGEVDRFRRDTGMSDMLLPLPLALPKSMTGRWLIALGPDFSFPTATNDNFGKQQWTAGVTGVFGYMAENWMAGVYPQYYWGFADQGRDDDKSEANFGNMFYWFWYNITDVWQVGLSPTINYNDNAPSGERWNVPVGMGIAHMAKIGGRPWRLEAAVEYSVVNEDDFGEVARLKINLIPIVPRPIKNPIFGE